ncbi:hypothetical protein HID58_001733 [Brassica napus]|uniref:RNase H type-1 domain-containing protein n=1 Tax=Brassica napus TaxID=3708 RepID=A0ABQ8EN89_BRANA|nr:hypothetical protein HID58_001733 [Brassica napus]
MASSSGGGHEKDQYVLSMQPGTLRQGTVAVMEAYTANAESLVVLSDSQLLIGLLQTKSSRKELNNILTDIHHFSNRLSACSFIHISRLCNVGANLEAKSALLSVNSSPPTGG